MAGGMNKPRVADCEPILQPAGFALCDSKLATGALVVSILLTAWPRLCVSQVLTDPTRPPAGIYSSETTENAAVSGPVLQSVMISPTQRSAIIGGKTVNLGGTYGDARIIKITEGEVVLRSASGTETLRMYPDVSIKPIESASSGGNKRATKKSGPAVNTRGKQK
jgi:MSHA biogenesis protein MshK